MLVLDCGCDWVEVTDFATGSDWAATAPVGSVWVAWVTALIILEVLILPLRAYRLKRDKSLQFLVTRER